MAGRRPTYRVQRQRRARARHGAASCCVPVPASAPVRGDRWSTGHGARGAVDGHELPPVGYLESPLHGHTGVGCHVRTNLAPCIVLFLFFCLRRRGITNALPTAILLFGSVCLDRWQARVELRTQRGRPTLPTSVRANGIGPYHTPKSNRRRSHFFYFFLFENKNKVILQRSAACSVGW